MSLNGEKYDRLFKILILGEAQVGKTCILIRYTEDSFIKEHLQTVGFDYKLKNLTIDNKVVVLQIWDTNGQERFHTVTKQMMKNAQGMVLVYDITDHSSFDRISTWADQIGDNTDEEVVKVLVGNKLDRADDRAVKESDGKQLSNKHNIPFFECSAFDNTNIDQIFDYLAEELLKKKEKPRTNNGISIKSQIKKNKKCC